MTRKICILLALLIAFVSFLYTPQAQTQENKWKKTVTLPNGDVILDLNGEWDSIVAYRRGGPALESGITKITQTGNSFVGVSMKVIFGFPKGKEQIKGELDKNGFKQVQIISRYEGTCEARGQIGEDGNQIIIDDGERFRLTLTRK